MTSLESPPPVNFDSVALDSLLNDWITALQEYSVDAVLVLGPDPFGQAVDRIVLAVHPPRLVDAAKALAESQDFGAPWRDAESPLVAWQDIAKSAYSSGSRWRRIWLAYGYQSVVRVEFSLPAGRAFECFMFSARELHDRTEAAALVWSALNIWPLLRRAIADVHSRLSAREVECLSLAFQGKTARQSGEMLNCTERTIGFHMANAMAKLKVDNKLAAIQRACWMGAI